MGNEQGRGVSGEGVYTVEGTLPAAGNGLVYGGPFLVAQRCTVNAITTVPGMFNSDPATAAFVIESCD